MEGTWIHGYDGAARRRGQGGRPNLDRLKIAHPGGPLFPIANAAHLFPVAGVADLIVEARMHSMPVERGEGLESWRIPVALSFLPPLPRISLMSPIRSCAVQAWCLMLVERGYLDASELLRLKMLSEKVLLVLSDLLDVRRCADYVACSLLGV